MADKTRKIEALKHQIAKLQEEAGMIERWGDSVRALDSFTVDEKIKVFNELYKQAREYLYSYVEDGWQPKDGDHYLYEAVLSKMLGENVWGIINSI